MAEVRHVPLNTRWSEDELAYALTDSTPVVLMVDDVFEPVVGRLLATTGLGLRVVSTAAEPTYPGARRYEDLAVGHEPAVPSERDDDDLYGIFYTGGTTGRAKGVMLSHSNLIMVSLLWIATLHFDDATRYLHVAQLFHMAGAAPAIALTLVGGTHVGENVFSGEVEQIIYELPAVSECAVIGIPDPTWGEAVCAVVVPKPGTTLTAAEVTGHCRARIAHYKCPSTVEVRTESLPVSGAGKLLEHLLREPYWAELPPATAAVR